MRLRELVGLEVKVDPGKKRRKCVYVSVCAHKYVRTDLCLIP